jgi:hypothetical protein
MDFGLEYLGAAALGTGDHALAPLNKIISGSTDWFLSGRLRGWAYVCYASRRPEEQRCIIEHWC